MSDTNEGMSSVYEFSDDVAHAEAPVPLPVGEYRASVKAVDNKMSKNNSPMMVMTYHVSADQYPADYVDGNPDGESMNVYFVVQDNARGRFRMRKHCEMHGVTPGRRINSTDFIGQEVIVQVTHEEYQGEKRPRLQPVRAA